MSEYQKLSSKQAHYAHQSHCGDCCHCKYISKLETELAKKDELLKEMQEVVKAVAMVGVDFGYGKYYITEGQINTARELIQKIEEAV